MKSLPWPEAKKRVPNSAPLRSVDQCASATITSTCILPLHSQNITDHQMSHLLLEWQNVNQDIQQLHKQQKNTERTLAFRFVEGTLVQAVQKGDWVLLDEINLATPETLECLCGLLENSSGSVVLMERG